MSQAANNLPVVSVIVPFQNNRADIRRCCESLLAQRYPPECFEIIFIENNSTDGSADIVGEYSGIALLRESQPGSYAARNRGLQNVRGSIVAFTDADCVAAPDWLASIADGFSDPSAVILVGAYAADSGGFAAAALSAYENAKNRYVFSSSDESLYYGYTNNMAVRRDVFQKLGLFSTRMRGADQMFVRRQTSAGGLASVRFHAEMRVAHLETQTVWGYCRKVFVHSCSIRALREVSPMRVLSNRERWAAFRRMVRDERYSPAQAAAVLAILVVGLGSWVAGSLARSPEPRGTPEGTQERLGEPPQP